MRDEMDARIWVEHGAAFSESVANAFARAKAGIDKLLAAAKPGFDSLHAYYFDAPWRRAGTRGPHQA